MSFKIEQMTMIETQKNLRVKYFRTDYTDSRRFSLCSLREKTLRLCVKHFRTYYADSFRFSLRPLREKTLRLRVEHFRTDYTDFHGNTPLLLRSLREKSLRLCVKHFRTDYTDFHRFSLRSLRENSLRLRVKRTHRNFKYLLLIFPLLWLFSCKKAEPFPITEWNSNNNQKPVIFYISGDAGFNKFSKSFSENLHQYGYDVFALNTKKYFWKKRTPSEASKDTEKFLKKITTNRSNKKIILIGFSYGADVTPFIYNRFDNSFKKNIQKLVIIGPSKVNDFEIHISDYILGEKQYGFSVIHEINRLGTIPFTLIVSDFEYYHFPFSEITLKNYGFVHLHGDHHYGGNTKKLADFVVKNINSYQPNP